MLDLTTYKTKAGAAKALAKQLKKVATRVDIFNPDNVLLYNPEEWAKMTGPYLPAWTVFWNDNSPYEWAIKLTLGMSHIEEFLGVKLISSKHPPWGAESFREYSLSFY